MRKELIYLAFLTVLLASCEEFYTPNIDSAEGQLVVEALITNNPSKNYVHLTKTRGLYDNQSPEVVSGARVELVEINGKTVQGYESGSGYFLFNTIPAIGKNYKLRILVHKDTYESEEVTMPPLPTIEKFYTENKVEKIYKPDAYGVPVAYDVQGRGIYVDAPVTIALSHYRFDIRSILEWTYDSITTGPPEPTVYGWFSYYERAKFNLAEPKRFSQTDKIEKHPLLTLSYNFLHSDSILSHGWILIIDQFGTSKGSYEFHEKLNSQFAADGSLFDPIQTQVNGNIICKTDPAKIVFGYFDLNSCQQIRYYINLSSPNSEVVVRQLFRYPYIPDEGSIKGEPPVWWE